MFDIAKILQDDIILEHFTEQLLLWFQQHGRHDLPWQVKNDPYKVWVSEIMLQQTQVKTVLNYYPRFIARFPTVHTLAQAEWDDVAPYWAGLGYYARARNLHKASRQVIALGQFPQDVEGWQALSGVGRSTAGALMSLGLGKFGVILDGNVKRVLARFFAIDEVLSQVKIDKQLWQLAERLVPRQQHAEYTQAIMDLGATICTPKKPLCHFCPVQENCQAYRQGNVLGFPVKKQKKAVPIKVAYVLLLRLKNNQGQMLSLWQQREHSGLWGGLYSLPILEQEIELHQMIQELTIKPQTTWQIQHHFTHFTWQLQVYEYWIAEQQQNSIQQTLQQLLRRQNQDLALKWLDASVVDTLAMPTAMQKISQHFKIGQWSDRATEKIASSN